MRRALCASALAATVAAAPADLPAPDIPEYVALGDAITGGALATRTVAPQRLTAYPPDAPDATAFAPRIARALGRHAGVRYANLATNGATMFTVWNAQIPAVDSRATVVTVAFGVADQRAVAAGAPLHEAGLTLTRSPEYVRVAIQRLARDLHAAAPHARIVIANVPNAAALPGAPAGAAARAALARAAREENEAINALASDAIAVVDRRCDPASYDRELLEDGEYPNDRGHAHLADMFLAALQHPSPPRAACPPYGDAR